MLVITVKENEAATLYNAKGNEIGKIFTLNVRGYEFFGNGYYEYGDIGRLTVIRVQSHLISLETIQEGFRVRFSLPASSAPQITQKRPWQRMVKWLQKWF